MARTLKGTAVVVFLNETTMKVMGKPIVKTYRGETPEEVMEANDRLWSAIRQLVKSGRFGTEWAGTDKPGTDITLLYTWISAYEDNGALESHIPACKRDLGTGDMDAIRALCEAA